jgi:hypothetical protein
MPASPVLAALADTVQCVPLRGYICLQTARCPGRVCGYWPQLLGHSQRPCYWAGCSGAHRAWQQQVSRHLCIRPGTRVWRAALNYISRAVSQQQKVRVGAACLQMLW